MGHAQLRMQVNYPLVLCKSACLVFARKDNGASAVQRAQIRRPLGGDETLACHDRCGGDRAGSSCVLRHVGEHACEHAASRRGQAARCVAVVTSSAWWKPDPVPFCDSPSGYRPRDLAGAARRAALAGEGAHSRREGNHWGPPAAADGRGRRGRQGDRCERASHAAGGVRGSPPVHRVLPHVALQPASGGSVRGLCVLQRPAPRAVPHALPRLHVRDILPGSVRGKRPLPRLHGLGRPMVLGA